MSWQHIYGLSRRNIFGKMLALRIFISCFITYFKNKPYLISFCRISNSCLCLFHGLETALRIIICTSLKAHWNISGTLGILWVCNYVCRKAETYIYIWRLKYWVRGIINSHARKCEMHGWNLQISFVFFGTWTSQQFSKREFVCIRSQGFWSDEEYKRAF